LFLGGGGGGRGRGREVGGEGGWIKSAIWSGMTFEISVSHGERVFSLFLF